MVDAPPSVFVLLGQAGPPRVELGGGARDVASHPWVAGVRHVALTALVESGVTGLATFMASPTGRRSTRGERSAGGHVVDGGEVEPIHVVLGWMSQTGWPASENVEDGVGDSPNEVLGC
jgi:hypothetical protein